MTYLLFHVTHNIHILSKFCKVTEKIEIYLWTEHQHLLNYYRKLGFSMFEKLPKVFDSNKAGTTTKYIMIYPVPILSKYSTLQY